MCFDILVSDNTFSNRKVRGCARVSCQVKIKSFLLTGVSCLWHRSRDISSIKIVLFLTRLNQQCTVVFVPIRDKFTDYVCKDRTVYMPTHARARTHKHTQAHIYMYTCKERKCERRYIVKVSLLMFDCKFHELFKRFDKSD